MEKLSLEKFMDVKLESEQMEFVHAGDSCTGGGVSTTDYGNGVHVDTSYESDCILANGRIEYYGGKTRLRLEEA